MVVKGRGIAVILISACLAGLNVRYNGTNCIDDRVQKLVLEKKAITVVLS